MCALWWMNKNILCSTFDHISRTAAVCVEEARLCHNHYLFERMKDLLSQICNQRILFVAGTYKHVFQDKIQILDALKRSIIQCNSYNHTTRELLLGKHVAAQQWLGRKDGRNSGSELRRG